MLMKERAIWKYGEEKVENQMNEKEKVLLVGVDLLEGDFETSMKELQSLAEACQMKVVGIITQRMQTVNKALYVGSGKAEEIKEFAEETEADVIVFDNALSPSQLKNLQKELQRPVLDRTALILDIFSTRARTREAKLQVETARLQYLLPRLVGMHEALTRQGGTSGSMSSKGAGEKKLELDRRHIEHRISELRSELEKISRERRTQRKRRQESSIPKVALVGYTNVGKSTIMNALVDKYVGDEEKRVLEKDMLFATLETTVRRIVPGDNQDFLLSDTVGFIHKLPHGLIQAFRSTLEEVKEADLLLHVVDCSDENFRQQMKVTEETLRELEAGDIPVIYVFNKADLCQEKLQIPKVVQEHKIYISAKEETSIEALVDLIVKTAYQNRVQAEFLIPYNRGNDVSYLMERAAVKETDYQEEGVYLSAVCDRADVQRFEKYRL